MSRATRQTQRPLRAGIYLRQSLDKDKGTPEQGRAVERQRQDCEALAKARGWQVVGTYSDNDVSASNGKPRPKFEQMLAHAEAGNLDVIVAWHADRLARKVTDLERVVDLSEKTGLRVATVSGDLDLGSDAGRLVARILVSVARGETERKGARQRRANRQRAEAGMPRTNTSRPFGFERDGITVREEEADLLRDAYATVLAGGSLNALAQQWTAAGVPTRRGGKQWGPQVVRQVLLNPRNIGQVTYHGEVIGKGRWPALVDEATFDAVRVMLTDPSRRATPAAPRRTRLLSGLVRCGVCDDGTTVKASSSRRYPTYICRTGKHVSRAAEAVDDFVTDAVLDRLSRADARDLLVDHDGPDTKRLHRDLVAKRKRRDSLAVEYAGGTIGLSALRAGTKALDVEIEALESQITHADRAMLAPLVDGNAAEVWQDLDLHRKRAVIAALCEVTLLPMGKGHGRVGITPDNLALRWLL